MEEQRQTLKVQKHVRSKIVGDPLPEPNGCDIVDHRERRACQENEDRRSADPDQQALRDVRTWQVMTEGGQRVRDRMVAENLVDEQLRGPWTQDVEADRQRDRTENDGEAPPMRRHIPEQSELAYHSAIPGRYVGQC